MTLYKVSKSCPCLICGKPDWCLCSDDSSICCRAPQEGAVRYIERLKGWEYKTGGRASSWAEKVRDEPPIDATAIAKRFKSLLKESVTLLADSLGLSVDSLIKLDIGWSPELEAWSFPMRDGRKNIVGIRLRSPDGAKFAVRGSKEGLFIPWYVRPDGPLYICEGPTDTAAMLDIGLPAIGRPCAKGGYDHIIQFVEARRPVIVVGDHDEAGRAGAEALASGLRLRKHPVTVIEPPAGIKDARAWVNAGATRHDIEHQAGAPP